MNSIWFARIAALTFGLLWLGVVWLYLKHWFALSTYSIKRLLGHCSSIVAFLAVVAIESKIYHRIDPLKEFPEDFIIVVYASQLAVLLFLLMKYRKRIPVPYPSKKS